LQSKILKKKIYRSLLYIRPNKQIQESGWLFDESDNAPHIELGNRHICYRLLSLCS